MSQLTPQAAAALLRDQDQFLILTHRRPDGDTTGDFRIAQIAGGVHVGDSHQPVLQAGVLDRAQKRGQLPLDFLASRGPTSWRCSGTRRW